MIDNKPNHHGKKSAVNSRFGDLSVLHTDQETSRKRVEFRDAMRVHENVVQFVPRLSRLIDEIHAGCLAVETASKAAASIHGIRQQAITAKTSPSDVEKLLFIRAGH